MYNQNMVQSNKPFFSIIIPALNAEKSNAILMVTAIGGNHHRIDYLIGPGKALEFTHH